MFGSRYLCLLLALLLLGVGSYGQSSRADTSPDPGIQLQRVDATPGEAAPVLPWPIFAQPIFAQPIFPQPILPQPILPRRPSGPGAFGFVQLAQSAGMIFSGTVTSIKRTPKARGPSLETVAITFQVENAIRGATAGQNLTISQWMGLWSGGQRYRIGERVLLFLYPESKLGLTSCVAYPVGRFPVDSAGRVLLSAQHLSAFRRDPVLGGKARTTISDFALAVRSAEESSTR